MSSYQGNILIKNPATPTGPAETGSAPGIWKLNEALAFKRQGIWPTQGVLASDTYFPYVSLLLSTTALSNANNNLFVDSSGAFNPISRNGNTTQGSVTPYSASWSNYFDGTGDYLDAASNAAFGLGTGDFTIEMWVFPTANPTNGPGTIFDLRSGPTASATVSRINSSLQLLLYNGPANTEFVTGTITLNTWTHIAFVRASGSVRTYINGTLSNTTTVTSDLGSSQPCYIGTNRTAGYDFNGNISNFRIVKGTAVYTSNFTVPTAPLTAISGTSILTCQSNRFRDASANSFAITVTGNTRTTDFSPFAPASPGITYNQSDITNWSGYFQNTVSGNRLQWSFPGSAVQNAVAGTNYTIEFWVYRLPKTNTYQCMFSTENDRNNILLDASGNVYITSNGKTLMFSGFSADTYIPTYQWTHLALVCAGTTWTLYFNGTSYGTYSGASKTSYATGNAQLGARNDMDGCGYMSNFRVSTVARYSANFTPPTSSFTNDANTAMLALQNAAFSDNSSNAQAFSVIGSGGFNPTVTGNSPFNTVGYWSNYFDGTGDYLSLSASSALNQSGDFTIEAWIYLTATPSAATPIYAFEVNNFMKFGINTSRNLLVDQANVGVKVTGSTALNLSTWYHMAFVRSGSGSNNCKIYLNGVQEGQFTDTSTATASGTGRICSRPDATSGFLTCYLSNLRVTNTAVYTTAFTPSTTPLTAISGTQLLTCQASRLIDSSSNAFTLTRNGDVSVQSFDPFYTATIASNGGSMYFDGSGDYVTAVSPSFAFGTGAWTVEFWVYPLAYGGSIVGAQLFGTVNGAQTGYSISLGQDINSFRLISNASGTWADNLSAGAGNGPPLNAWSHMVVVRSGANISIYRNGTRVATTASAASWNFSGTTAVIGRFAEPGNTRDLTGYLSNMRVTGAAVYDPTQSTLTVPTAPVNPIPNTVIMPNGMNAGAYDATAINNMETVGDAQVRFPTPFAPANYYAGAFDGTGDYLAIPSSAGAFGSSNFTIEAWFYPTGNSGLRVFLGQWAQVVGTGREAWLCLTNGTTLEFYWAPFSTAGPLLSAANGYVLNAWNHYAVVRSGNTFTMYVNGVSVASATSATTLPTPVTNVSMGNYYGASNTFPATGATDFAGYVSNARIVNGTAVYTANFTPSTTPLTAISGTSLLTCQNKTFIDNSTNAFTITAFGNATAGAIGPFTATGGTSMYFDGTGDYLVAPNNAELQMSSGNFTVEFWWYPVSLSGFQTPFEKGYTGSGGLLLQTGNGDGRIIVYASGTGVITASTAPTLNTWNHMALVRNGTSLVLYLNGTSVGSATNSTDFNNTGVMGIGANASGGGAGAYPINGYIDDLRVTKGVARYTANFTPPTTAFLPY